MTVLRGLAYSGQHALLHSDAHDLSEQQPFDASLEQHFLVEQGLLQSEALPVAAHELSANAEIATADINDNCWITFFIFFVIWLVGVVV